MPAQGVGRRPVGRVHGREPAGPAGRGVQARPAHPRGHQPLAGHPARTARPTPTRSGHPTAKSSCRRRRSATDGTAIDEFNADGTDRQVLVNDGKFNTDPEVSPDGTQLAYSAFQGSNPVLPGQTLDPLNPDDIKLNPEHWIVTVRDQTHGQDRPRSPRVRSARRPTETAKPGDSSGWKPVWSPDGKTIAWTGRLNCDTTCICAANADGSDPRVLVKSSDLVIKWFDWSAAWRPGAAHRRSPTREIGSKAVSSRLLISSDDLRNEAAPDPRRAGRHDGHTTTPAPEAWPIPTGAQLEQGPLASSCSSATSLPSRPTSSTTRRTGRRPRRASTSTSTSRSRSSRPAEPAVRRSTSTTAQKQIFLHRADGTIVQLTNAVDRGLARRHRQGRRPLEHRSGPLARRSLRRVHQPLRPDRRVVPAPDGPEDRRRAQPHQRHRRRRAGRRRACRSGRPTARRSRSPGPRAPTRTCS